MKKSLKIPLLLAVLLAGCLYAHAQGEYDSIRKQTLREVRINADEPQKVFSGPAAVQQITAQQIKQLPTLQLSDALKYMSGVVVRDYGGTGGMKTVSVRGLGTQHTGVAYDDIAITDCQTGQIDLGKLSLENVASLSLIVGLDDRIFVPARLFSYSSLLKINTINTIPEKPFSFRVGGTVGMYGLYELQAGITHKVRRSVTTASSSGTFRLTPCVPKATTPTPCTMAEPPTAYRTNGAKTLRLGHLTPSSMPYGSSTGRSGST